MDSAVPYSLSDIQLPDSPSNIVKPAVKAASKKETLPTHFSNDSDKDSHSDNDLHRNGLNSASKAHSKVKPVSSDASKKIKISVIKPKNPDHQSTESKKSSKTSDIVTESAFAQKNKKSKKEQISDVEEKPSKKLEGKSYPIADKYLKSHTISSSSEESSASSGTRKKRQPRSKISVKHSKIHKNRSSSSSSQSSQSEERIPEKLSKEDKSARKKPIELDALKASKKRQKDVSNKKISESRSSSSSNRSSQSRETSPVETSKKDVKQPIRPEAATRIVKKHHTKSSSDQQASKSRSQSPSISQSRDRSSVKPSKENTKNTTKLDASRIVEKHSKSSSDLKASKSRSCSPNGSRSSQSRERSPVKPSKDSVKKLVVSESSRIVRKRHTSSSDKKTSKSRSHSPITRSSRSREKSPLKPSKKDVKKSSLPDAARNLRDCHTESGSDQKTSKSRSCSPSSNQEPVKPTKDVKNSVVSDVSRVVKKHRTDSSSNQKTLKSRSRSPSSSQSRERSPMKASKEDIKKSIVHDVSTIVRKRRTKSGSDQKTSKSRSRSPCSSRSSQSRERSPMKTPNEGVKKLMAEDSMTIRKHHTEEKTSKSRSCSPSKSRSSLSQEKSPVKSSTNDVKKLEAFNDSRTSRKRQAESSSDQKTRKNRSRSSSTSPPPHQTLELFFSQSKIKKAVQPSKENVKAVNRSSKISGPEAIGKHNEGSNAKASAAVEQKADLPRKKLKINRNNVIIQSIESSEKVPAGEPKKLPSECLGGKTSEVSPSSPKEEKELREPTSPIQPEVIEREMGEIIENSPEVKYEPRKINFPGRKFSRKSSEDLSSTEPKSKKSKWGKFASSQKSSQTINISTDSLKNWFPEFKLVNEPSVVNDSMPEESPPVKEDKKLSFPLKSDEESTKQFSFNTSHENNEEPTLEVTDSSGPVSRIVFIQNLVRPFTLLQLKDLLRQTGNFVEEDFWIDKIKSKCFVTYATEEEAVKTRNALNGSRWPSSNPKILSAEFSTEEEFEHHRSGKDLQKPVPERLPEVHETYEEKTPQPTSDHRRKDRDSDKRKDKERYRPQAPVREWDKDKVLQDSPDREKTDKNMEGFRGADKKDKKDTKKRMNEDTPAKLLDDLFQKTKSVPCIYWLPLTEARVLEHEESKRLRRLEREKRNQQREKEESELRNKRSRLDHKSREMENRRSSTRSRSPTSRRR